MRKKKDCLLRFLAISILVLSACNNYHTDVLELEQTLDSEEEFKYQLSLIKENWEKTQIETLSDSADVSMEIAEGSITPTGFTIIFENNSDKSIIFEDDFIIETRVEEEWYQLPMLISDYDFSSVGCKMPYKQSKELSADWKNLYGDLERGEYRILKEVTDLSEPNNYNKECLAVEFKID